MLDLLQNVSKYLGANVKGMTWETYSFPDEFADSNEYVFPSTTRKEVFLGT